MCNMMVTLQARPKTFPNEEISLYNKEQGDTLRHITVYYGRRARILGKWRVLHKRKSKTAVQLPSASDNPHSELPASMSFLIRAFGGIVDTGHNSASSKDTELMAIEEGQITSGSLGAGAERPQNNDRDSDLTYVPGHFDSPPSTLNGEVETSLTAVDEGQMNPLVNQPVFQANRQPVEDHPLSAAQFPIVKSRPTWPAEPGHTVHGQMETGSSSVFSARRKDNRNHPYLIKPGELERKGRALESMAQALKLKVGHNHSFSSGSDSELWPA